MSTLVALCEDAPELVKADHVRHAAHNPYGPGGHDLDRWIVRRGAQPTREQLDALGVASDAKYHSGYIESGTGRQCWVYTAIRPMSDGACERCLHSSSERLFAQRGLS